MDSAARYVRDVDRHLLCPASLKRSFLRQLEDDIWDYSRCSGKTDEAALIRRFGAPEAVAKAFLEEMGPRVVERCTRTRKRLLLAVVAVTVLTAVVCALLVWQSRSLREELPEGSVVAQVEYSGPQDQPPLRDTFYGE